MWFRPFGCFCHLLILVATCAAWGQDPAPNPNPAPAPVAPTVDDIQAKIQQIEQSTELKDDAKATLKGIYEQVLSQLGGLSDDKAAAESFQNKIQTAPTDIESAKGGDPVAKPADPAEDAPLQQLIDKLAELDASVQEKKKQLNLLTAEPSRRAAWNATFPKETQDLQTELEEKKAAVANPPPPDDPVAVAKHTLATTELFALQQKLERYQKEKEYYAATGELVRLQVERLAAEVNALERALETWRAVVNQRRETEAAQQADIAQAELQEVSAQLQTTAQENATLAADLTSLTKKITTTSAALEDVRKLLQKVTQQYERSRNKIETIGLSDATGRFLRSERNDLPDVRERSRGRRARQTDLQDARFESYSMQNQWADVAVLESAVLEEAEKLNLGPLSPDSKLHKELTRLLDQRRELLKRLADDYGSYAQLLLDADVAEQQLIQITNSYADFIDGYVFWIRSAPPVSYRDTRPALDAGMWLLDLNNWQKVGDDLVATAKSMPWAWVGFVFLFGYLLRIRGELRTWIGAHCGTDETHLHPTFPTMLGGLLSTAVIALPWPALLAFIGWQLHRSLDSQEFTRALASGLIGAAWMLYPLDFFRQLLRPRGIAQASLHWAEESLLKLRGRLRELLYLAVPLYTVTVMLERQSVEPLWSHSLGRFVFVVLMAVITMLMFLVLRAQSGAAQQTSDVSPQLAHRLRRTMFTLLLLTPAALAALALWGYHSTAQDLARLLFESAVLLMLALIVVQIVEELLLDAQRQLARRETSQRLISEEGDTPPTAADAPSPHEDDESEAASREPDESPEAPAPPADEIDVVQLGSQARRLLHLAAILVFLVGSWMIWRDVLPAFSLIDKVTLPGFRSITGGMLFRAALSLVVMVVAVRNVAGLLEFVVLRHVSLDSGARYAAGVLARYLIVGVGVWYAASSLGVSWSSLQWLIAAMGVGLGFGLQEIFANFTSGLILLFERPVRVGDVITVDNNTGTVKTIRMRSTTITGWDRKDYVIPNKDLITGRLLNWTLSDEVQRIKIDVGVAYGSDTERARELLIETAHNHPAVLDEPPPVAAFEAFGDSALALSLRCFVASLSNYLRTITELHTAIDAAFKAADIEIAFPQHDIHIRSDESGANTQSSFTPNEAQQDDRRDA